MFEGLVFNSFFIIRHTRGYVILKLYFFHLPTTLLGFNYMLPLCEIFSLKTATKGGHKLIIVYILTFFPCSFLCSWARWTDFTWSMPTVVYDIVSDETDICCCDTVWFGSVIPKFLRKVRPPYRCYSQDGNSRFLWNVRTLLPNYMVRYPKRLKSWWWE